MFHAQTERFCTNAYCRYLDGFLSVQVLANIDGYALLSCSHDLKQSWMLLSSLFPTGIVSSISFSPQNGMLAVGSYSQTTAVYAEGNMEPLYVLHGQLGGVTQVCEATLLALAFAV